MLHDSSSFLVFLSALSDKWCISFFLCVFRSIDCEYGCDCWFSAFLHLAGGAPSACSCAADGSIFFVGPPPAHNGACPSNVAVFAFYACACCFAGFRVVKSIKVLNPRSLHSDVLRLSFC